MGQSSGLLLEPVLLTGMRVLVPALLLLTGVWMVMPALLTGKEMFWMDLLELRAEMLAMSPLRWV